MKPRHTEADVSSADVKHPLLTFLRSGHNYDAHAVSVATGLRCLDPSLAQQSMKEESDINTIVRRFGVTGQLPQGVRTPTFADFEDIFDFRTAQDAIIAAERSFMAMPADIRFRFGNDPQEFVAFCSEESNLPELRKLGLAVDIKVDSAQVEPPKVAS
ncbi:MAG: internal scaffolding protein [Microvirus sp.]|nr:MAG: internal scaffolding protein [Microvirus sp.]